MTINLIFFTVTISKRRSSHQETNWQSLNHCDEKIRELKVKQEQFFQNL